MIIFLGEITVILPVTLSSMMKFLPVMSAMNLMKTLISTPSKSMVMNCPPESAAFFVIGCLVVASAVVAEGSPWGDIFIWESGFRFPGG
ncbi:MAG: hypothetical protein M0C28_22485 [Candidatus Moduliflexus flocculans]|nr:hypothetical protein [Candidatus Moduliflexus flocculans]